MNRIVTISALAGLLVGAAACTDTAAPSKPAHLASGSSGVVTYKVYTHLTSPSPYCKRNPTIFGCKPRWVLEIRTSMGDHHTFDVSKATYHRCGLNDRYPACASGGR